MQSEDITITYRNGALLVSPGTPSTLGISPEIKPDRLLLALSDIKLTVWFIGEVTYEEKRSVSLKIIQWLISYRKPVRIPVTD